MKLLIWSNKVSDSANYEKVKHCSSQSIPCQCYERAPPAGLAITVSYPGAAKQPAPAQDASTQARPLEGVTSLGRSLATPTSVEAGYVSST